MNIFTHIAVSRGPDDSMYNEKSTSLVDHIFDELDFDELEKESR